jgi:hypothetical protein
LACSSAVRCSFVRARKRPLVQLLQLGSEPTDLIGERLPLFPLPWRREPQGGSWFHGPLHNGLLGHPSDYDPVLVCPEPEGGHRLPHCWRAATPSALPRTRRLAERAGVRVVRPGRRHVRRLPPLHAHSGLAPIVVLGHQLMVSCRRPDQSRQSRIMEPRNT